MNSTSKAMKREMMTAAQKRLLNEFPGISKKKRCALARKGVDMFVAKIRADVKKGVAYVEPE